MDRKFDEKKFKKYLEDNKERLDKVFAEWVAKTVISEHDAEDGASFLHECFDAVFDQLFEGFETDGWDDFVKEPDEEDEYGEND